LRVLIVIGVAGLKVIILSFPRERMALAIGSFRSPLLALGPMEA
jgi:hypothetical protein